ncbi:FitA-like ribbon-helix-helix domain-containing protein [Mesorhizobium sp. B1-1-8]|uniref:FitA-like ribbon-helix-helix domain-containing protein n=1 Tax=Mesorhizobium sp. B1-1-8 TaxID=2589976 RepID=UPI0011265F79|nr:Arc family DNA-binding protein [Mesorhizobium sp. B1-1-8]UCI06541.1 Arc family DNA-binding protein [Mesorhizobium sp. B1-1-8]
MPAIAVRSLLEETQRALRVRAAAHNRSMEAEIRAILEDAVRSEQCAKLGSLLCAIASRAGVTDQDVQVLEQILASNVRKR